MKSQRLAVAVLLLTTALVTPAVAEQKTTSATASECTVRAGAGGLQTQIVICPPGLDMYAWRDAGIMACQSLRPCKALIWDNPDNAPVRPPRAGEQMPKEQAASMVAVWYNDTQEMAIVRRVEK